MPDSDDDEVNDPTWHPPSDTESESDEEFDEGGGCFLCCRDDDSWFMDNGDPEDALITGLMTFVANRKTLEAEHIPLYLELLRELMDEATTLYK
tara:strand:+ start:87 stop:368 length:282 start_codon:yes stop_codon:yes gene_type:complete